MNFNSQETEPSDGESPAVYSLFFGLPNNNVQNLLYQPGSYETFGHHQTYSGSHMPPYDGGQVVGAPHSQSGRWHHPNINPSETNDLGAVSCCLLLTSNYI
jgi:hypothetical protein